MFKVVGVSIAKSEVVSTAHLMSGGRAGREMTASLRVLSYNLLAPAYAVKWREPEGMTEDGQSNWAVRWPALRANIERSRAEVVLLQEVDDESRPAVEGDLTADGYRVVAAQHAKRRHVDPVAG